MIFYHCSIRAKVQVSHMKLLYCCKVHNLVIHGFAIKFIHLLASFYPELYVWKSLNLKLPQQKAVLSTDLLIISYYARWNYLSCLNALLDLLKERASDTHRFWRSLLCTCIAILFFPLTIDLDLYCGKCMMLQLIICSVHTLPS